MQLTQESIDQMFAMPQKYRAAVEEFSHSLGMDPELVDVGDIPEDAAGAVAAYEYMMEHNALTPAALTGYFARAPGAKRALYCMPIALDKVENGAEEISHVIASMADGLADLGKGLMKVTNRYADAQAAAASSL